MTRLKSLCDNQINHGSSWIPTRTGSAVAPPGLNSQSRSGRHITAVSVVPAGFWGVSGSGGLGSLGAKSLWPCTDHSIIPYHIIYFYFWILQDTSSMFKPDLKLTLSHILLVVCFQPPRKNTKIHGQQTASTAETLLLALSHSFWAVSPAVKRFGMKLSGENVEKTPNHLIWLVVDLPLWKIMEFVSWDDDIANIWKVIIHSMVPVTTNQWWSWWLILIFPWKNGSLIEVSPYPHLWRKHDILPFLDLLGDSAEVLASSFPNDILFIAHHIPWADWATRSSSKELLIGKRSGASKEIAYAAYVSNTYWLIVLNKMHPIECTSKFQCFTGHSDLNVQPFLAQPQRSQSPIHLRKSKLIIYGPASQWRPHNSPWQW